MINHRKNWLAALLAITAVAVLPVGATAKSSNGLTSFHGKVASVSTADGTFKLRRANGATLTFRVTSTTVFQRLGGRLGALRAGRAIEVKARKADGRWTARKVEPDDDASGGSGRGGSDDGPNHDAGDDHGGDSGGSGGSGRGGADDGPNHDAGDDHGSGGHGSDD